LCPETRAALHVNGTTPCDGSLARDEALRRLAAGGELHPVGLVIGPFSLATRLLADPIPAVALLAAGAGPDEEPAVRMLLDALEAAEETVAASLARQVAAGAGTVVVCEPAASTAFISPRAIRAGTGVFDRLVVEPNLRLKGVLDGAGVALFFHDCGELCAEMVEAFGHRVRPAVLSLGSSRRLWEDAARVPEEVVLYGNLPTRTFYSDEAMPAAEVERLAEELAERMWATGHPFVLGSECDVLHVEEAAGRIWDKLEKVRLRSGLAVRA
jgi:uroporphyrinogen-III decarboxylase